MGDNECGRRDLLPYSQTTWLGAMRADGLNWCRERKHFDLLTCVQTTELGVDDSYCCRCRKRDHFGWLSCAQATWLGVMRADGLSWCRERKHFDLLPCARSWCRARRRLVVAGLGVVSWMHTIILAWCHAIRRLGFVLCVRAFWLVVVSVSTLITVCPGEATVDVHEKFSSWWWDSVDTGFSTRNDNHDQFDLVTRIVPHKHCDSTLGRWAGVCVGRSRIYLVMMITAFFLDL